MSPRRGSPLARWSAPAAEQALADDVRSGLSDARQKTIPSRWLYDNIGTALFEAICLVPEYGLARADARILGNHALQITELAGHPACVAELGSGGGSKTRLLLEPLAREAAPIYVPIDVSSAALSRCEAELAWVPGLRLDPFHGEYLEGLSYATRIRRRGETLMVLFLGSSLGNFHRPEAEDFLREMRGILAAGDFILLGTDLLKPETQLIDAYDDSAGITAAFNLNLLGRLNRELGARFDLFRFYHEARWNQAERRIEMHLRSLGAQRVDIPGAGISVSLRSGETIWTESSYKFEPGEAALLARRAGYRVVGRWSDARWPFCESLLRAV